MENVAMKWDSFKAHVSESFMEFRNDVQFSDVILVSDDEIQFKSHKLILSRSSEVFKSFLINSCTNPVFYLIGIRSKVIEYLLDYFYFGEVAVPQDCIDEFFEAASKLKIQSLLKNRTDHIKNINFESRVNKMHEYDFKLQIKEEAIEDVEKDKNVNVLKFNCNNCDRFFKSRHARTKHYKNDHLLQIKDSFSIEDALNILNEGGMKSRKSFSIETKNLSADNLNVQEMYTMLDKGQYKCNICDHIASQTCNIKNHVETHIDGLKVSCDICKKTFRTQNALSTHNSRHHRD